MAYLSPLPKMQFFDANGDPLVGGKLYTYAAGTTTPLATYTSSSGAVSNTNPVILDSRGEANVWLALTPYKFKLTTASDVEIWTVDNVSSGETFGASQWLTSVAGINSITASLTSANFVAYAAGQTFSFKASNTNTGPVTLNINSLGAKAVTKTGSVALEPNDILSGQIVTVVYDGVRFQLSNLPNLQAPGVIGSTIPNDATFTNLAATDLVVYNTVDVSGTAYFHNNIVATDTGTVADIKSISSTDISTSTLEASGSFGYGPTALGTGGSVTQATSRTTGVTLNKVCGQITLFSTTATAGAVTEFTVTNSTVVSASRSIITVALQNPGASTGVYMPFVSLIGTGSFRISLYCITAPAAAESPIINFAVMNMVIT